MATLIVTLMSTETGLAQLSSNNGYMYFKNQNQHLYGNGVNNLSYKSNNNKSSFSFYDKTNTRLGIVYGSLNADGSKYFGLLDGDGDWSYLAKKDVSTAFRINNDDKMIIRANGRVELTGAVDADDEPSSGVLEIAGSLRLDGNEIITNKNNTLYINKDNNGDVSFDEGTLKINASDNRVELNGTADANDEPNSGVLEIAGSLRLDGNEIITNKDKTLYINQDNNGDVDFDKGTFRVDASANKVSIGDVKSNSNNYKLFVEKGILTEKVRVSVKNSTDWADYVFEEDYDLNSLEEVENFVTENKHLPNVPSAEEVNKNGVDMAKMDATLLRQIEELWLHLFELKKENQILKNKMVGIK